jgi:hypothetical protein
MDTKRQIINQFFYWLHTSVTSSTVVPLDIATLSAMKKWSNKRNDLSKRGKGKMTNMVEKFKLQ